MATRKINTKIIINAPLKLVWDTMFDEQNTPNWSTMFLKYEKLENNKVKINIVAGKKTTNRTAIMTKYEEYKTFGWSGPFLAKFIFSDNHRFFVKEIDENTTEFSQSDEMSGLLKNMVKESLYTDYDQALKIEAEKRFSKINAAK